MKSWIQGNTNQFCPKCKKSIKILQEKEEKSNLQQENYQTNSNEITAKMEYLDSLNHGLDNMVINKTLIENFLLELQSTRLNNGNVDSYMSDDEKFIENIFKMNQEETNLFQSHLGSFEFGLPCEAVQYKGLKVKTINNFLYVEMLFYLDGENEKED